MALLPPTGGYLFYADLSEFLAVGRAREKDEVIVFGKTKVIFLIQKNLQFFKGHEFNLFE